MLCAMVFCFILGLMTTHYTALKITSLYIISLYITSPYIIVQLGPRSKQGPSLTVWTKDEHYTRTIPPAKFLTSSRHSRMLVYH